MIHGMRMLLLIVLVAGVGGLGGCCCQCPPENGSAAVAGAAGGAPPTGTFGEPEGQGVPVDIGSRWVKGGESVELRVAVEDKVYPDSGDKCTYVVECLDADAGSYFTTTFPFDHEEIVTGTPTVEFGIELETKGTATQKSFHISVRRKSGANNYKGDVGVVTVVP